MRKFAILFGLVMFQMVQCSSKIDLNHKSESLKSYLAKRVAAAALVGYGIDCASSNENKQFFTVAIPAIYLLYTVDNILGCRNYEYGCKTIIEKKE